MSKSHAKPKHHKHKPVRPAQRDNDVAVYVGLFMIGLFSVALIGVWYGTWQIPTVGYIIAICFLVNLYGWRAYLGSTLAGWQRSLAKIPLRFAGYGTRHGHALAAAKHQSQARMVLFVCLAVSVVIICGITYLLIPDVRPV